MARLPGQPSRPRRSAAVYRRQASPPPRAAPASLRAARPPAWPPSYRGTRAPTVRRECVSRRNTPVPSRLRGRAGTRACERRVPGRARRHRPGRQRAATDCAGHRRPEHGGKGCRHRCEAAAVHRQGRAEAADREREAADRRGGRRPGMQRATRPERDPVGRPAAEPAGTRRPEAAAADVGQRQPSRAVARSTPMPMVVSIDITQRSRGGINHDRTDRPRRQPSRVRAGCRSRRRDRGRTGRGLRRDLQDAAGQGRGARRDPEDARGQRQAAAGLDRAAVDRRREPQLPAGPRVHGEARARRGLH